MSAMKRRGGVGKDASDQSESVKVTSLTRVLHPVTRVVNGVAFTAGGIAGMFLWDWRYVAAGLMVIIGGFIVGPWVPPMPTYEVSEAPLQYGDDEVHL